MFFPFPFFVRMEADSGLFRHKRVTDIEHTVASRLKMIFARVPCQNKHTFQLRRLTKKGNQAARVVLLRCKAQK